MTISPAGRHLSTMEKRLLLAVSLSDLLAWASSPGGVPLNASLAEPWTNISYGICVRLFCTFVYTSSL